MKKLSDYVDCNPTVKLKKGSHYTLVDIDSIEIGRKYSGDKGTIEYTGQGGSKFSDGDTIMARITPCLENGKLAQYRGCVDAIGSTELFVFRAKKGISSADFVYYFMKQAHVRNYAANSMTGASGRQRADIGFIKKLKCNFPQIEKQERIASILSDYDDLIENNNKRIKILEKMAENLYKEWFSYKHMRDTAEYVSLGNIIQISRGVSYTSEEINVDEGLNLVNLKNIEAHGGFRRDGTKKYQGKYKKQHVVYQGDLIMGITDMTQDRRTVGSVSLVPHLDGISVISADLIKITSAINNLFLYAMFKYGKISRYIAQFANGANVLHLKPQHVLKTKVLLPERELIDKYVDTASPMFKEIEKLNQTIDILTKQRDLLLPRLMSGKLEV